MINFNVKVSCANCSIFYGHMTYYKFLSCCSVDTKLQKPKPPGYIYFVQ
jgi:hypothetical protein